jgi:uncharacterized membrane protein YphA (DoxX/SURF4 family)
MLVFLTSSSMLYDFGPLSSDLAVLVLRLGVAAIFLAHGTMKIKNWTNLPGLMRFLGVVEPLGALGVLTGVLMQPAALGLSIIMLGAIPMHIAKWHQGFISPQGPGWSYPFITLAGTLALLILGEPGVYSIGL